MTTPQSLNRYSYVENNPLIYTDPSGHQLQLPKFEMPRPIGSPIIDPVGNLELLLDVGVKEGWIGEQTAANVKSYARNAGQGLQNLFAEPVLLSYDLATRAMGSEGEARSGLVRQYDSYRKQGDTFWQAVGHVARDTMVEASTLGLHGVFTQIDELKQLHAAGQLSDAEYEEALYGVWGEWTGGTIGGLVLAEAGGMAFGRVGGVVRRAVSGGVRRVGRAAGELVSEGFAFAKSGLRTLKTEGSTALRSGLREASSFATNQVAPRVNPFNYEVSGLGMSGGNVRFKGSRTKGRLEAFPKWRPGDPITKITTEGQYSKWFAKEAAQKVNTVQGR